MTGTQIFFLTLLSVVLPAAAWQELRRGNIVLAAAFAAIPMATWLAVALGNAHD